MGARLLLGLASGASVSSLPKTATETMGFHFMPERVWKAKMLDPPALVQVVEGDDPIRYQEGINICNQLQKNPKDTEKPLKK